MKKMMVTLLTLGALTACDNSKTPEKPKEFILDPGATVLVNGKESKAETESLEYIVKNAAFINRGFLNEDGTIKVYGRSDLGLQEDIYELSRDLTGYKFKFFGSDVIVDGKPGPFFEWVDMTFTVAVFDGKRVFPTDITTLEGMTEDTVAYIPNAVAKACKENILKALEADDLEECYRIFKEDYTYTPITGAELRRLKAQGLDNVQ